MNLHFSGLDSFHEERCLVHKGRIDSHTSAQGKVLHIRTKAYDSQQYFDEFESIVRGLIGGREI
jgi:hypothetical protein